MANPYFSMSDVYYGWSPTSTAEQTVPEGSEQVRLQPNEAVSESVVQVTPQQKTGLWVMVGAFILIFVLFSK